ncbi:Aromatic ring-opening dioxygenase, catalytic subunit, LigB family [Sporobacter termitidis DSM 10068]|uniref:Aromatic ring-opening dioxygenase, catalytic subunit, LigB family n=1 Tax=Sporobacter termitidis DSM 10068 TaxID=1123282 RepID=A0A1M5XPG6_9FIRM|nr:4,5-DOPA dioxygenase extradiol [Sporobacter termitidis]SHI01710.1 Aromatic ring-opening dioxygenase, catalytic subunit, LigB family [Sporobacter termitidis DSM 10068]
MSERMPALFVGHGSPMNAIEDNQYSKAWAEIGKHIIKPEAILSISAHWFTKGTKITDAPKPEVVYDMYGFPEALYRVVYQPHGSPELAHETKALISRDVKIDNSWGIDHGTWSVLRRMYPNADIPVYQLSVDADANAEAHFKTGRELSVLRDKGVMIFGSGNVVHNLSRVNWDMDGGYSWASEFDGYVKGKIVDGKYDDVLDYSKAGPSAAMAFHTPDHFDPLLYVLGASDKSDKLTVLNDSCTLGALSMTCYLFE